MRSCLVERRAIVVLWGLIITAGSVHAIPEVVDCGPLAQPDGTILDVLRVRDEYEFIIAFQNRRLVQSEDDNYYGRFDGVVDGRIALRPTDYLPGVHDGSREVHALQDCSSSAIHIARHIVAWEFDRYLADSGHYQELAQPDGTTIGALLFYDGLGSFIYTADGLIVKNDEDGFYYYDGRFAGLVGGRFHFEATEARYF